MDCVIVSSPAELRALISEEIGKVIPRLLAVPPRESERQEGDTLPSTREAARFLNEQGYPMTEKTLYNHVFKQQVPYRKFGRRTVFSRRELLEWLESRTNRPEDRRAEATRRIAESANRKTARR